MARLTGSTLRTVRFYEESGLLTPVERTEGGHRLFSRNELDKLRLVSDLRAAGFALEEIREMLDVKRRCTSGAEASREVIQRLDGQIRSMSGRITLLERLRTELESARRQLSACNDCKHDDHFPDGCKQCSVMCDAGDLPNAVAVLWNLER